MPGLTKKILIVPIESEWVTWAEEKGYTYLEY